MQNSKKDTKDDKNNMKDNEEKTNGGNTDGRFERNSDRGYGDVAGGNGRDNEERSGRIGDESRGIQKNERSAEGGYDARKKRLLAEQGEPKTIPTSHKKITAFVNEFKNETAKDGTRITI